MPMELSHQLSSIPEADGVDRQLHASSSAFIRFRAFCQQSSQYI
jgi:hypothetical protein